MPSLVEDVGILLSHNHALAYFIIYLGTLFFGNLGAFASLWYVFRGYVGPWGILIAPAAFFAAQVTGDVFWYFMGSSLRDTRLGNFIRNRIPRHENIEAHVHRHGGRWLLLCKFLYSASFAVLFLIGWSKITFGNFLRMMLPSIGLWLAVVVPLGYVLVSGLGVLGGVALFKRAELMFLAAFAAFFFAERFLVHVLRKRFGDGGGNDS